LLPCCLVALLPCCLVALYDSYIHDEQCKDGFMIFNKRTRRQVMLLLTGLSASSICSANHIASQPSNYSSALTSASSFLSTLPASLKHGHAVVQLGGYWSNQGSQQHINIEDLIGDEFTVTHHTGSNGLFGFGYFIDGQEKDHFKMVYGLNAFYLAKTGVEGNVIQENLFTNLSYRYHVTHYPLYAMAKSIIKTKSPKHALTLDVGIGPNFMRTGGVSESSLDGITLPDNIFSGRTTTTFAATVGAGIRFNQFFGEAPLECGYRFFYLGQGRFNKETNQVINTLNTGRAYANALMCSITV
jgi:hypothetical protein